MQYRIAATALAAAFLAVIGYPRAARAQNPQPAPPALQHAPVAPPNAPNPPPEKIEPNSTTTDRGTLKPPNVDPGMAVQPPANTRGTMPVVRPPGTPGGNQRVVPK
jgi:hypothetical protein